jgi:hypothetical protein
MRRRGTIRAAILIRPVVDAGGYADIVLDSVFAGLRTYQESGGLSIRDQFSYF